MATATEHFLRDWNTRCGHVRLDQQVEVSGARIPLAYAPAKLAIDVDADASASPRQRQRVRARRREWNAAGWQVIAFSTEDLATDTNRCVCEVQAAIEAILDGRTVRWEVITESNIGVDAGADRYWDAGMSATVSAAEGGLDHVVPPTTMRDHAVAPWVERAITVVVTPFAVIISLLGVLVGIVLRIGAALVVGLGSLALGAAGFLAAVLLVLGLAVWGLGQFLHWATPPAAITAPPVISTAVIPMTPVASDVASGTVGPGRVQVISVGLNVRREPRADAVVLTVVRDGDQLTVRGRSDDGQWLQVEVPNAAAPPQATGWVAIRYVTPLP